VVLQAQVAQGHAGLLAPQSIPLEGHTAYFMVLFPCYPGPWIHPLLTCLEGRRAYIVVLVVQLAQRHVGAVALTRRHHLLEPHAQGHLGRDDATQRESKGRAVLPACPASNARHTQWALAELGEAFPLRPIL